MVKTSLLLVKWPRAWLRTAAPDTLTRLARYTFLRATALSLTVVVGVYLTVFIANMGGHVDSIRISQIRETVGATILTNPEFQTLPPSELQQLIEQRVQLEVQRLGLDQPFIWRSFTYLSDALSLNLGRAERLVSDSGSRQVRLILLERLPATLLLFATIFLALFLSRQYGSFLDKVVIALAPTSAAPSWFYGIFLILLFASVLRVLPFGGMVEAPPPERNLPYTLSVLKHMVLPVTAMAIGS